MNNKVIEPIGNKVLDKEVFNDEEIVLNLQSYFTPNRINRIKQISVVQNNIVRQFGKSISCIDTYAKKGYTIVCALMKMSVSSIIKGSYLDADVANYFIASAHTEDEYEIGTEIIINPQTPPLMKIPVQNNEHSLYALNKKYKSQQAGIITSTDLKDAGVSSAANLIKEANQIINSKPKKLDYAELIDIKDYFLVANSMIIAVKP